LPLARNRAAGAKTLRFAQIGLRPPRFWNNEQARLVHRHSAHQSNTMIDPSGPLPAQLVGRP